MIFCRRNPIEEQKEEQEYPIVFMNYSNGGVPMFSTTIRHSTNKKLYDLQQKYFHILRVFLHDDSYKEECQKVYDEYLKEFIREYPEVLDFIDAYKDKE